MHYTICVHHHERYVEVSASGPASTQGFLAFVTELLEPAISDLNYDLLVNFSSLDTSTLGSENIRSVVAFLEMRKERLRPRKNALVATSALTFGFARMYQILAEGILPMKIQVFSSSDQAVQWLREDASPAQR